MTLLLIGRKVWDYKLVTLPILALMLAGVIYVVAIKDPLYTTSASYALVNPPAPPTRAEIERNPKLGEGSDNPYTRFSDQSVIVQVLAARLDNDEARQNLVEQGADRRYTLERDVSFGLAAPIVRITGTGSTPAQAVATAEVVGRALTRLLTEMQQQNGVGPDYRITSELLVGAQNAKLKASGKLRELIAVLAVGAILLFLAVSALDAVAILRRGDVSSENAWEDVTGVSSAPPSAEQVQRAEPAVVRQPTEGRSALVGTSE